MVPHLDARQVGGTPHLAAVEAVRHALQHGLEPAADPPRWPVDVPAGQLLVMPSVAEARAGIKVAAVAPGNPRRGLPRIQATYLLMDSATLELLATLDGTALTLLRTPAVTVAALEPVLRRRTGALELVVIGGGPQAAAHRAALESFTDSTGRSLRCTRLHRRAAEGVVLLGAPEAEKALGRADVVICATSAARPLFDSGLLAQDVVVAAIGSHEPDKRELDAGLMARSQVVVEDPATALREAGDVVLAVGAGALHQDTLVPMADVVTGRTVLEATRPVVFKGVGMAWQDLVVADLVYRRWLAAGTFT